jgi:hypothetical protein
VLFEGLAQCLEVLSRELTQLIEKEDSAVRECAEMLPGDLPAARLE